ncbi:MAG: hypothetical protein ABIB61_03975 [Candidatus Shapirobacteria bacterium]
MSINAERPPGARVSFDEEGQEPLLAYGIDYEVPEGKYWGDVFSAESLEVGQGPTCVNRKGEKRYALKSGKVEIGQDDEKEEIWVNGEGHVYLLDLRESGIPFKQLKDPEILRQVIKERKGEIRRVELELGETIVIPPMVLHQPVIRGILEVRVLSDYFPGLVIDEDSGVYLSDFVEQEA